MNKLRRIAVLSLVIITGFVGLFACAAPVYNVEDKAITITTKHNVADVKKAIIRAGASLGWVIKEVKPGHLEGTLLLRDHMAKVSIPYTSKTYSIIYKDSDNLGYDGSSIHKNYNGWIHNLDRNIQVQLSTL